MNHTSEDDDEKAKTDERYGLFIDANRILSESNF